jgi:hypothetical protein
MSLSSRTRASDVSTASRPVFPLNISLLTASIAWPARMPWTMLASVAWEGS